MTLIRKVLKLLYRVIWSEEVKCARKEAYLLLFTKNLNNREQVSVFVYGMALKNTFK